MEIVNFAFRINISKCLHNNCCLVMLLMSQFAKRSFNHLLIAAFYLDILQRSEYRLDEVDVIFLRFPTFLLIDRFEDLRDISY